MTSPLSGMTVMATGAAEADHMKYVKAQMPYNLTAFILSAILFLVISILYRVIIGVLIFNFNVVSVYEGK